MEQRRYTIDEIDSMREAIVQLRSRVASYYPPYSIFESPRFNEPYLRKPETAKVEEELRTYMIGSVAPAGLCVKAKRHTAKLNKELQDQKRNEAKRIDAIRFAQEQASTNRALRELFKRAA